MLDDSEGITFYFSYIFVYRLNIISMLLDCLSVIPSQVISLSFAILTRDKWL
jgi:hypothetical protein